MRPGAAAVALVLMLIPGSRAYGREHSVTVDLTEEKADYERRSGHRTTSLVFLVIGALGGGATTYGWLTAVDSRNRLLEQTPPINLVERQELLDAGQRGNTIGVIAGLVAVSALVVGVILFIKSL